MSAVNLVTPSGAIERYHLQGEWRGADWTDGGPGYHRRLYAAAHVVAAPLREASPWLEAAIDWDATLAVRRRLWGLGFAVAEAMDTAQRGMGLDWPAALELIRRGCAEARATPGAMIACGVGTDHLASGAGLDDVIAGYLHQAEAVEAAGGRLIVMASRALAAAARGPDDYARVYGEVLRQAREPVILHWLGEMFDPALAGYWGSADPRAAMQTCLSVIADHADRVDGVKISLLDAGLEIEMRRRLPAGVRMYTGDDFNFPELIRGDAQGQSDALLGIFAAIAPVAAAAFAAHARGDLEAFARLIDPTVPLSRHIFKAPTRFYKTGVVFMAYLTGAQDHFHMVGGQQGARSVPHLCDILRLADRAGLIPDPDLAAARMRATLVLAGVP